MTEAVVTLREIAQSMGTYGSDPGFPQLIDEITALVIQLGTEGPMATGTGGAYADHAVSAVTAEIIVDVLTNTDPETGVYSGDRGPIAALAADPDKRV